MGWPKSSFTNFRFYLFTREKSMLGQDLASFDYYPYCSLSHTIKLFLLIVFAKTKVVPVNPHFIVKHQ